MQAMIRGLVASAVWMSLGGEGVNGRFIYHRARAPLSGRAPSQIEI